MDPIIVTWENDDIVTITHGANPVGTYDHDEYGTSGMLAVLAAVDKLAASFGVPVTVIGEPGI